MGGGTDVGKPVLNANLRDGSPICILAMHPDDKDRLADHLND